MPFVVFDDRIGFGTRRVRPVGIGVVVVEVIRHGLDHRLRNLRAAGAIEVPRRFWSLLRAFERGETLPYFFNRFLGGGGDRTVVFL